MKKKKSILCWKCLCVPSCVTLMSQVVMAQFRLSHSWRWKMCKPLVAQLGEHSPSKGNARGSGYTNIKLYLVQTLTCAFMLQAAFELPCYVNYPCYNIGHFDIVGRRQYYFTTVSPRLSQIRDMYIQGLCKICSVNSS